MYTAERPLATSQQPDLILYQTPQLPVLVGRQRAHVYATHAHVVVESRHAPFARVPKHCDGPQPRKCGVYLRGRKMFMQVERTALKCDVPALAAGIKYSTCVRNFDTIELSAYTSRRLVARSYLGGPFLQVCKCRSSPQARPASCGATGERRYVRSPICYR
eukprot:scaffold12388_cov122-Isochrysis_galbana.AAC.10